MKKHILFSGIMGMTLLLAGFFLLASGPATGNSEPNTGLNEADCVACPMGTFQVRVEVLAGGGNCYRVRRCNANQAFIVETTVAGSLNVGSFYELCLAFTDVSLCNVQNPRRVVTATQINGCF